jgi:RNA polymerase sigma-70 factor (ECF subfamily)
VVAVQVRDRVVDDAEFARFYRGNLAIVRRLVARRIVDRTLREEAVQDAFTRAHLLLAAGHPEPPMRVIAKHASVDVLRRHQRRMERVEPLDPVDLVRSGLLDSGDAAIGDPQDMAIEADRRKAIVEALRCVEPKQRRVLVLREVDGLPYEAIASTTGASPDALRSLVKRGRARFCEAYMSIAGERGLLGAVVMRARGMRRRLSARVRGRELDLIRLTSTGWLAAIPAALAATAISVAVATGTMPARRAAAAASPSARQRRPASRTTPAAVAPNAFDRRFVGDETRPNESRARLGTSVRVERQSLLVDHDNGGRRYGGFGGDRSLTLRIDVGPPAPRDRGLSAGTPVECTNDGKPVGKRDVCLAADRLGVGT